MTVANYIFPLLPLSLFFFFLTVTIFHIYSKRVKERLQKVEDGQERAAIMRANFNALSEEEQYKQFLADTAALNVS